MFSILFFRIESSLTIYTQEISRTSRKSEVRITKTDEIETTHTMVPTSIFSVTRKMSRTHSSATGDLETVIVSSQSRADIAHLVSTANSPLSILEPTINVSEIISETYTNNSISLSTTLLDFQNYSSDYLIFSKNVSPTLSNSASEFKSLSANSSFTVVYINELPNSQTPSARQEPSENNVHLASTEISPSSILEATINVSTAAGSQTKTGQVKVSTFKSLSVAQSSVAMESSSLESISDTYMSNSKTLSTTLLVFPSYSTNLQIFSKKFSLTHSNGVRGLTSLSTHASPTVVNINEVSNSQTFSERQEPSANNFIKASSQTITNQLEILPTLKTLSMAPSPANRSFFMTDMNETTIQSFTVLTVSPSQIRSTSSVAALINTPPFIRKLLPTLHVSPCNNFKFKIPWDTFYDRESGNTTNLRLMLLTAERRPLGLYSWLMFNPSTQTLSAIPTGESYLKQLNYSFLLIAEDKEGLQAEMNVTILLSSSVPTLNYKIEIVTGSSFSDKKSNVDVLSKLMGKIGTFLGDKNSGSLFVELFQRGTGSEFLSMVTFGNCSLVGPTCNYETMNYISSIILNRNEVHPNFKNALLPNFRLMLVREKRLGPCAQSYNSPPELIHPIETINITSFCQPFQFAIPQLTFFDKENGNTSRLLLSLNTLDSKSLGMNSWIQFKTASQLVYGFPTRVEANKQSEKGYQYILTANDSGGKSAQTVIRIKIAARFSPSKYNVTIAVRSYFGGFLPTVELVEILLSKISKYLGIESGNGIRVLHYRSIGGDQEGIIVTFTFCSQESHVCDFDNLRNVSDKLMSADGEASEPFQVALLPNFMVQEVLLSKSIMCEPNQPPTANYNMLQFNVSLCQDNFRFKVPEDAFFDKEDGVTSSLSLLLQTYKRTTPSSSSWIQFDNITREIYGKPTLNASQETSFLSNRFYLIARDKEGQERNITVVISFEANRAPLSYNVSATIASYYGSKISHIEIVMEVFNEMRKYLNEKDNNSFLLISFEINSTTGPYDEVFVKWSYCSINRNLSIIESKEDPTERLQLANGMVNPHLIQFLAPKFIVKSIEVYIQSPVLNTAPRSTVSVLRLNVSLCHFLDYTISNSLFYDKEDTVLQLHLLDITGKELSLNDWIHLNRTSNTITGIPTSVIAKQQPRSGYKFYLVATDSGGLKQNVTVVINVTGFNNESNFSVTFVYKTLIQHKYSAVKEQLLLINRLSSYLGQTNESNIRVESYTQGFGRDALNVFTWSSCALKSNCSNMEAVSLIKGQLKAPDGSIQERLVSTMKPDFYVEGIIEKQSDCGGGVNTAPTLNKPIGILNISVCNFFRYQIPSETFSDIEDGNTRNLLLKLTTTDNQPLRSDFWIQLNNLSQEIYALPVMISITNQTLQEHKLLLWAIDKKGKTASTLLKIVVVNFPLSLNYQITITVGSYFDVKLPRIYELIDLVDKISFYLGNSDRTGIVVVSWNKSNDNPPLLSLSYANCSWPDDFCTSAAVKHALDPFRTKSNKNKAEFFSALLPQFVLDSVHEEKFGICILPPNTPPTASVLVITVNISTCGFFESIIPADLFHDNEDGGTRNLTLRLLTFEGSKLPSSHWLQFNQQLQAVYGFPYKPDLFTSRYQLIARDKGGLEANTTLVIVSNTTHLPYSYSVDLSFLSYIEHTTSDQDVLLRFFSNLMKYLENDLSVERTRILSYNMTNSTPSLVRVLWTNCSTKVFPCRMKAVSSVSAKLRIPVEYVNPNLIRALAPYFIVYSADLELQGPCKNTPPILMKPVSSIKVPFCSMFRFDIPESTFYDKEEGLTRNLSVSFLDVNGEALSDKSWLQFNSSSQTIVAIPTSDILQNQPQTGFEFLLLAKDEQDLMVNTSIILRIAETSSDYNMKITLVYKSYENTTIYVNELALLINKLESYFWGNSSLKVKILSTFPGSGYPATNLVVWTICSLHQTSCNFSLVQLLSEKLNDTKNLNGTLQPHFSLETAFIELTGPCSKIINTAPKVKNNISLIVTNSCVPLQYQIPAKTFLDKEDGDTRNLTLSLLTDKLQSLPLSSWVQFDTSTQKIYALTRQLKLVDQLLLGSSFVLIARDSGDKFARSDIKIKLQESLEPDHYHVTVNVTSNLDSFQPDIDHLTLLLEKTSRYLDDKFLLKLVWYNKTSNNPVILTATWAICLTHSNSCDIQLIANMHSKLIQNNEKPKQDFSISLLPEFALHSVTEEMFGPCLSHPPIVNRKLNSINISLCGEFRFELPSDLFYDEIDGDTKNLSLNLVHPQGKPLSKDIWIKLNDKENVIYGVPSLEVFKQQPEQGYEYLLVATDSGGLTQNTSIAIKIFGNTSLNHKIDIVVVNHAFPNSDRADVIISLLQKIASFFGDGDISVLQVLNDYTRINNTLQLFLSWNNCSLKHHPCNFAILENLKTRLIIQKTLVNPSFMRSLAPDFVVQTINFVKLGPCLNTRPQTDKEVLAVNASFCKLFNSALPENLFYDKENGNTSSLMLSITNRNNSNLPISSWIQLNKTSRTLYGILTPEVLVNQPIGGYNYYLHARDDGYLETKLLLRISIVNEPPQANFIITFIFQSYFDSSYPYADEQLLLMKKVSQFLGSDIKDFNVISFIRGKGYPSLNVLKWSNCSFNQFSRRRKRAIISQCNFAGIEMLLKTLKFPSGEINPKLKSVLLPTFDLRDMVYQRFGPCLKSPNDGPKPQTSVIRLNISVGHWNFKYRIPYDTFVDNEDGLTPFLLLSLREHGSQPLSKQSWVQFNSARQELYGFVSHSVVQNQPKGGYRFELTATDSGGKSATIDLVIHAKNFTSHVNLVFKVVAQSYMPINLPDVDHALKLASKLFLHLDRVGFSNVIPISFNKTEIFPSNNSLLWTTSSFMGDKCNISIMQNLISFLERSRNVLKAELSPEFQLLEVSHHQNGSCLMQFNNHPVVRRPLEPLRTSICGTFKFVVPEDTFYDIEDGTTRNMKLNLLDHNGKNIGPSSWVQLNSSSQTIFGLPLFQIQGKIVSTPGEFFIVATDRVGAKTNTSLIVSVFDPVPSVNYMITMDFLSYIKTNKPDIEMLQVFLEKMIIFLQTSKTEDFMVKVISYNSSSSFPKRVSLTWSSCVMDYKLCDYQRIKDTWSKLSIGNGFVHPNFIKIMAPEFTIGSVNPIKLGSCLNQPPKANHALIITNVGVCNSIAFKVPTNTFSDYEDGDTSNLTLFLASTSGERLGKNSWLYLNGSSQVLYSVLSINQIKVLKKNEITFFLFARDKGGLTEKTEVRIFLDKNQTNINYEVSIALRIYYASNVSDAYLLYKLRSKIESYVGNTKGGICFVSFTRGTNYPSMSLVSFSFCSLSQSSCDVSNSNFYSTKINEPSLKLALLPKFDVISVFEKRLGPCSEDRNEPPRLQRPIKPLIINISYGMVTYVIPANTFNDREDGDTKNLTLSLLMVDMQPVGFNSWIQIKAQTIYALPASSKYREQPKDGYNFLVVATDSGKKFTIAHLQVYPQGNQVNSPTYQINISVKSFYPTDTSTIFQIRYLTEKLGKYIGKTMCPNEEWHIVEYEKSSSYPAILSTTVSTCTNTCDVAIVEYVFSKMFTPKETILDQLKQAIAPFFYIESIKLIRCTSSSQLVATFGRLFRVKVPEKVMSEMRDRGHKNITLSLRGPSFSNWLMLDKDVNMLYGIPLFNDFEYQNGSSVNYTLFTIDQDGKSTEHIFEVFITPGDFCSSTPSLVLMLNNTEESFTQNPSRRVEMVRKLTSFLRGNESDLFVRSVQGTKRNSTDAVLVGIVNDSLCGKFGASAFVDALVTGKLSVHITDSDDRQL